MADAVLVALAPNQIVYPATTTRLVHNEHDVLVVVLRILLGLGDMHRVAGVIQLDVLAFRFRQRYLPCLTGRSARWGFACRSRSIPYRCRLLV